MGELVGVMFTCNMDRQLRTYILSRKNLKCTKATTIYLKPENITLSIISNVTYPAPKQRLSGSFSDNIHCLTLNSYPTPVEIPYTTT